MTKVYNLAVKALVTCAVSLALSASLQAKDIAIYQGETPEGAGIVLVPWGSGTIVSDSTAGYISERSLAITSSSLYNGGSVLLNKPIEIAEPTTLSQYDYLEITARFKTMTTLGLGNPNFAPLVRGEYRPIPADYYGGVYPEDIPKVPKAQKMHVLMTSNDGRIVSAVGLIRVKQTDEEDWISVAIPLSSFGIGKDGRGFEVRRISMGIDFGDTFNVGQIRVVTDNTPIYVEPLSTEDIGPQDVLLLRGIAEAGKTALVYSWDFNAADGIQEDAVGQLVDIVYKASGSYTVTLTVKDPTGIKEPVTTTVTVEVS